MTKLRVGLASDIHLEFGMLDLKNESNVDVLVLAGDICLVHALLRHDSDHSMDAHKFFSQVSQEFPHIVYVVGNHEHYDYDFPSTIPKLKEELAKYENIHILEKDCFILDDTIFIGATMWTNMNDYCPISMNSIKNNMNDFICISNSNNIYYSPYGSINYVLRPEDVIEDHELALKYFQTTIDSNKDKKIVIVSHHAPSYLGSPLKYTGDYYFSGGYASDLSEFILNNPIKFWFNGHSHDRFDYMVGDTRVITNPRGYFNYEAMANTFELKVIEI